MLIAIFTFFSHTYIIFHMHTFFFSTKKNL
nr:MAG TPA: hypothetical protein [Caudoviricetes sp.]